MSTPEVKDMGTKHTPGPWYATTRQGSWDWVVAQSKHIEICQMFHDGTELNDTGEANAKLVAASPVMIGALRDIAKQWPDSAAAKTARAAIAKAEGRS